MTPKETQDPGALLSELLRSESTLSLATTSEGGAPAVAPLFYLPEPDLSLCWLSSRESRHSQNAMRRGDAAVSVYAGTFEWEGIRGVQLEGKVETVEDPVERRRILDAYAARFRLQEAFGKEMERSAVYRFIPRWFRYLDNSKGFGFRLEGELSP